MTAVKPPPIYENVADEEGKLKLAWVLFMNGIYTGDTGTTWTPTFTNLTVVGAAPTLTGKYYRIGKSLAYFNVKVVPGTNTSSTAGTTYISNFPLRLSADGACIAVSGLLGGGAGMCDQSSNNIYVPAWSAVTVPLTIVGLVETRE